MMIGKEELNPEDINNVNIDIPQDINLTVIKDLKPMGFDEFNKLIDKAVEEIEADLENTYRSFYSL
ncbi:MAG TPA: hypothetical protein DCL21_05735 [Alphaproteobacteria bacterium]|nr:hypothetical protein [Alphaproteobacteria bacterium]